MQHKSKVMRSGSSMPYAYVEISNRKIIGVGIERFREGGWVWRNTFTNPTMTLQQAMTLLVPEWPEFYDRVRREVKDELLSLSTIKQRLAKREVKRAKHTVKEAERELIAAKRKLAAAKKLR